MIYFSNFHANSFQCEIVTQNESDFEREDQIISVYFCNFDLGTNDKCEGGSLNSNNSGLGNFFNTIQTYPAGSATITDYSSISKNIEK